MSQWIPPVQLKHANKNVKKKISGRVRAEGVTDCLHSVSRGV
jgi:hypothetical protein